MSLTSRLLAFFSLILSGSALAHNGQHGDSNLFIEIAHLLSHWNHLSIGLGIATLLATCIGIVLVWRTLKGARSRSTQS